MEATFDSQKTNFLMTALHATVPKQTLVCRSYRIELESS